MEIRLYFFSVFLVTIIITRIFLYINPTPSPTIKSFRIHHYMYGLFLIPVGILLSNVAVYAVGVGLFIDEFGYLIIGGKTHEENYSKTSLILLIIFVILTYIFRNELLFWVWTFLKTLKSPYPTQKYSYFFKKDLSFLTLVRGF